MPSGSFFAGERLTLMSPEEHMPAQSPRPGSTPAVLWQAVLSARADRAQLRKHPVPGRDAVAHTGLLDALEGYVQSLQERGRPVPYVLRDELCIERNIHHPSRPWRNKQRNHTGQ
jgi:hypothetical protein